MKMKFAVLHKSDLNIVFPDDTYVFRIDATGFSEIFSSLYDLWRRICSDCIPLVYEDLFVFGLSIFAIDKRMGRNLSKDNWTREISVQLPVHNTVLWNNTIPLLNTMLSFLTGDKWDVQFYDTGEKYSIQPIKHYKHIDATKYQSVCLFSGGLDSLCGAIKLVEEGQSLILLGHNEYPKLREKQHHMADVIENHYEGQSIRFFDFSANARAPFRPDGYLNSSENTCRSRSLLFLTAAVSIAGIIGEGTKVYIPENGFISINVPLTASRQGSCSTRTTHPYFLSCFSQLLQMLSIKHEIVNPFQFLTKREVVETVQNTATFQELYPLTISCSHPCNGRWKRLSSPSNCGYCYPCLIRKASLIGLDSDSTTYNPFKYSSIEELLATSAISASDIKALIAALHRYKGCNDNMLLRLIRATGPVSEENINKHLRVYKSTMEDVSQLLLKEIGYSE